MSRHHSAHPSRGLAMVRLCALLAAGAGFGSPAPVTLAQSGGEVVAVVNGRRITREEVDSSAAAQLLPLDQQMYAIRKAALENLILRAVLESEAEKRGITVEELRRRLTDVRVEVSPGQVEREYLENAHAFGSMSPDEAREKLRLDLENQARLRRYRETLFRLKESSDIKLLLEAPRPLSVAGGEAAPSKGAPNAAVTITVFSDFQCPYCKGANDTIRELLRSFGKDVRLIFRHLPLGIHPQAFASAQAAFCAGVQGSFWQYHDALFAAESLSPETLHQMAVSLGLNVREFQSCLNSERPRAAVIKDMQEAQRLGIDGTPTFIINGKLIRGAPSLQEFRNLVERELHSAHPPTRSN